MPTPSSAILARAAGRTKRGVASEGRSLGAMGPCALRGAGAGCCPWEAPLERDGESWALAAGGGGERRRRKETAPFAAFAMQGRTCAACSLPSQRPPLRCPSRTRGHFHLFHRSGLVCYPSDGSFSPPPPRGRVAGPQPEVGGARALGEAVGAHRAAGSAQPHGIPRKLWLIELDHPSTQPRARPAAQPGDVS